MADETRWQQHTTAGTKAYEQLDYAEAVKQYQLSLKEAEDFGEETWRFATTLNYLAIVFKAQGRYEEAESLFTRALAIFEKTLGSEHPMVIVARKGRLAATGDRQ